MEHVAGESGAEARGDRATSGPPFALAITKADPQILRHGRGRAKTSSLPCCRYLENCGSHASLTDCLSEPVEDVAPACLDTPRIARDARRYVVDQGQFAAVRERNYFYGHPVEALRAQEFEPQPVGSIHFEIFADVFDVFAVAPVDDVEPASDASVDLGTHDLVRCFRKQPFARSLRIKPCIENALGRCTESACHTGTDLLLGVDGHGSFFVLRCKQKA